MQNNIFKKKRLLGLGDGTHWSQTFLSPVELTLWAQVPAMSWKGFPIVGSTHWPRVDHGGGCKWSRHLD